MTVIANVVNAHPLIPFNIFPVGPDKKPLIRDWQTKATRDPRVIAQWSIDGAMAWGVPCGAANDLFVIDLDVERATGDAVGEASLRALPGIADLLNHANVITPSGGRHVYLRHFDGARNTTSKIGPKIDTRGEGGFVILPGSITSGGVYQGEIPKTLPDVPSEIRAMLGIPRSPHTGALIIPSAERITEAVEYWTHEVRDAAEGERNTTLNNAAFAFGQIIAACPDQESDLVAALEAAAADCGLDVREADQTIRSGIRGGKNKPERAPEGFNGLPVTLPSSRPETVNPLRPDPIADDEWNDTGALTPTCITENLYFADVGVRVAPGGVGKTTLALYEAICLALGYPIFGCVTRRPGVTCILTSEDRRAMLIQRLRKICEACNLSSEQIEQVRRAVRIVYVEQFKLTCVSGDMVVPSDGVRQVIESFGPLRPSIIWIDPAVSFGVGESRVNDAEQGLITAGRMIRNAVLDCAVMYIHHTGKANARDKTLDQYSGRGGSAMADGSRMVQVMKSLNPDEWLEATGNMLDVNGSAFVLARPKLSYVPPQGPIYIKRVGWLFLAYEAQASGARNEKAEAVALALLRKRWERGEDVSKYRAHAALAKDPEADGIKKNKFDEAINSLINAGTLKISKNKRDSDIIVEGST